MPKFLPKGITSLTCNSGVGEQVTAAAPIASEIANRAKQFSDEMWPNLEAAPLPAPTEISYYRDILRRIAGGWSTPITLAQTALDHEFDVDELGDSPAPTCTCPEKVWSPDGSDMNESTCTIDHEVNPAKEATIEKWLADEHKAFELHAYATWDMKPEAIKHALTRDEHGEDYMSDLVQSEWRGWKSRALLPQWRPGDSPALPATPPMSEGEIAYCRKVAASLPIVEHPQTFPEAARQLFDELPILKYNDHGHWQIQVELADNTKAIIAVTNRNDGQLARAQIRGIALQLLAHWLGRGAEVGD